MFGNNFFLTTNTTKLYLPLQKISISPNISQHISRSSFVRMSQLNKLFCIHFYGLPQFSFFLVFLLIDQHENPLILHKVMHLTTVQMANGMS